MINLIMIIIILIILIIMIVITSSDARWLPMGADGVGALEAEMTRVAGNLIITIIIFIIIIIIMTMITGLGFDWAHPYTQCVFQTLLHHIRNR